jgi:hypothetical protein
LRSHLEAGRGNLQGVVRSADQSGLAQWMEFWRITVSNSFLSSYLAVEPVRVLLPQHEGDILRLLEILMLEAMRRDLQRSRKWNELWTTVPYLSLRRMARAVEDLI